MTILLVVSSALCAVLGGYALGSATSNQVFLRAHRILGDIRDPELFVGNYLFAVVALHLVGVGSLILVAGPAIAAASMSVAAYAESTYSYFRLQRFSDRMRRPLFVDTTPWLLPAIRLCVFAVSVTTLAATNWYFLASLPMITVLLGFACAELRVRELQRNFPEAFGDREVAIIQVNTEQGRGFGTHVMTHFPYP